jgi:hypothetical protein
VSALQKQFPAGSGVSITSQSGCNGVRCPDQSLFPAALAAAAAADVIVLVMGLDGTVEGEGFDRVAYPCDDVDASVVGLPGCQFNLVQAITQAMKPGQKVVLVLMHGGGVATPSEQSNPNIGVFLY